MIANISWTRPFDTGYKDMLKINETQTYNVILNFGIFQNEDDTSSQYMFGAKEPKDI